MFCFCFIKLRPETTGVTWITFTMSLFSFWGLSGSCIACQWRNRMLLFSHLFSIYSLSQCGWNSWRGNADEIPQSPCYLDVFLHITAPTLMMASCLMSWFLLQHCSMVKTSVSSRACLCFVDKHRLNWLHLCCLLRCLHALCHLTAANCCKGRFLLLTQCLLR